MKNEIKKCKVHGNTEHVLESGNRFRCKQCRSQAVIKCRKNRKFQLVKYRGGKCELCGYSKCPDALEFHHLDPTEKEFGLSVRGLTRSWEKQKEECIKCALLCANCHREVHAGFVTIPENYVPTICEEHEHVLLKDTTRNCKYCNSEFIPKAKNQEYCDNNCRVKNSRKIHDRPSKEQLQQDIKELGYCGTGRKYGVSDNTIRSWINK